MKECPKCGYECQAQDSECPQCGVVYEKYKANGFANEKSTKEQAEGQSLWNPRTMPKWKLLFIIALGLTVSIVILYNHFKDTYASEKRLAAFKEHLSHIKSRPTTQPVSYLVGMVRESDEFSKPRIREIKMFGSAPDPCFLGVRVDTQNYAYVRLTGGLSITEEGRQEVNDLLSKAKGWYRKAKKMKGSVKGKLVGVTSDGIEVIFTSYKKIKDPAERAFIDVSIPGNSGSGVLYFSTKKECNVDKLITLLQRAPHVAADNFYAEQQLQ